MVTGEQQQEDRLLTVEEVARMLGVSGPTVRSWIHTGALPHVLLGPAKRLRIRRRDLDRLIQGGGQT